MGSLVEAIRPLASEHEQGPSFELSLKDCDGLDRLLSAAPADADLNGLVPVGWYHSVSRGDLRLTPGDLTVCARFFPEPWQIAIVLKRSRKQPVSGGFFCPRHAGSSDPRLPLCEFSTDSLPPPADLAATSDSTQEILPRRSAPEETSAEELSALSQSVKDHQAEPDARLNQPGIPEQSFPNTELAVDPFEQSPNPALYYESPQHKEALAMLLYGIQSRKGYVVLIGSAGTGKTLLLECLADRLRQQSVEYAYLSNSKVSAGQFFELLAYDLELQCAQTTKASVLIALNEKLLRRFEEGQTTVLIVDSAEKLPLEVLEEIELLGNLETRKGKLLQVVFAAQPQFDGQMESPALRGLRQRLLLRAKLPPLTVEQTAEFIESRLTKAGLDCQKAFPFELVPEIHIRTRGIPRLINAVCGNLLAVCVAGRGNATREDVLERIIGDLELNRLLESQEPALYSAADAGS